MMPARLTRSRRGAASRLMVFQCAGLKSQPSAGARVAPSPGADAMSVLPSRRCRRPAPCRDGSIRPWHLGHAVPPARDGSGRACSSATGALHRARHRVVEDGLRRGRLLQRLGDQHVAARQHLDPARMGEAGREGVDGKAGRAARLCSASPAARRRIFSVGMRCGCAAGIAGVAPSAGAAELALQRRDRIAAAPMPAHDPGEHIGHGHWLAPIPAVLPVIRRQAEQGRSRRRRQRFGNSLHLERVWNAYGTIWH